MEYFVIGDEDTVLGFSLVGVSGLSAHTQAEAKIAFEKALDHPEYGIIIITDAVADLIRPLVDRYLFSESFPLIVEIPGPRSEASKRDIRTLVSEAIGVSI